MVDIVSFIYLFDGNMTQVCNFAVATISACQAVGSTDIHHKFPIRLKFETIKYELDYRLMTTFM